MIVRVAKWPVVDNSPSAHRAVGSDPGQVK